ncbi:MAG: NADAR family protein [Bacteroidota bacterium]|nr:NADAR family protein [Bacteroidota bacterium]
MPIWFKKVKEPYGWMGNMAPYPITYSGVVWRTSEALFQSLRYADPTIIEQIRQERSPMGAKFVAKSGVNIVHRVIEPMSPRDVTNMEMCVLLKFQQHDDIAMLLKATTPHQIYENATGRKKVNDLFWGAHQDPNNPDFPIQGQNTMGEILMRVRSII